MEVSTSNERKLSDGRQNKEEPPGVEGDAVPPPPQKPVMGAEEDFDYPPASSKYDFVKVKVFSII